MEESLINQGVELMLFGMGTVFVFLTLLVALTTSMSSIISRYLPSVETTKQVAVEPSAAVQPNSGRVLTDKRVIAVIAAAIEQHKNGKRRPN